MDEETVAVLKRIFKEYYFKHIEDIEVPPRIGEREFGHMTFEGAMIRHQSFKEPGDLRAHIVKEAPHSVYYSSSFYSDPSLPMHEKGWKGGELIFDIDADALSSPCRKEHDRWICRDCGLKQTGLRPDKCPSCKGTRLHEVNMACGRCLEAAKSEAVKLIDILLEDFGVQRSGVKTYFSGSMGYHISVEDPRFEEMSQSSRSEVADYVVGQALMPESLGVSRRSTFEDLAKKLPSEEEPGWRGRIARYFRDISEEASGDVKTKMAELIKGDYRKFKVALHEAVIRSGVKIDPTVTTDIHRIFRLPGTLHGKTGLLKKRCIDLESFNPLTDAVALETKAVKIFVDDSPKFTLMDEEFGPFKSEVVELPMMAAVYLLGRGMARVPRVTEVGAHP